MIVKIKIRDFLIDFEIIIFIAPREITLYTV